MSDGKLISIEPRSGLLGRLEWKFPLFLIAVFGLLVPLLYKNDVYGIDDVNMWGRYMCFALIAIGLDLVWGYTGMLSLCQALFSHRKGAPGRRESAWAHTPPRVLPPTATTSPTSSAPRRGSCSWVLLLRPLDSCVFRG